MFMCRRSYNNKGIVSFSPHPPIVDLRYIFSYNDNDPQSGLISFIP